ncbi:hypothetical protein R1sor_002077 [Riccia sorocarpa]|uniref:Protein phosphatase n=1 Tax=Riccia sorocarpa TaxID=122646 RepID=A0ABD3H144_9MARC
MPSLHKILKLKAGVRATLQLEAQGKGRLVSLRPGKNEKPPGWQKGKQQQVNSSEKPVPRESGAPSSRPSFVNSLVSSLSSGVASPAASARPTSVPYPVSTLDLKNGKKERSLTATAAIYRVISTPSVHGQFRHSSQILIDGYDADKNRDLSEKNLFVIPGRTAKEVLGRLKDTFTCESGDKVFSRRVDRGLSRSATIKQEALKERRWRDIAAEARDESVGRFPPPDSKLGFESLGERVECTEYGVKRVSAHSDGKSDSGTESYHGKNLVEVEGGQNFSGLARGKVDENSELLSTGRSLPKPGRASGSKSSNRTGILPRFGERFIRALHDVSLAGEGLSLERVSDGESPERQQAVSDGKSLKLLSGACNLPHPDKVKTGGEDAYFICPDKQVVGVADGVGGWADLGIDAGEYARELMSQALIAVREEPQGSIDPARVLEKAHAKTKCRGSSTACILALSDSVLEAANLGDSGFVILRNSRTVFKSPAQQHQFNIPFQLESGGSDPPSAAQVFSIEVAVGDVIVAGTDGLFDNLYDSELTTAVVQAVRSGMGPQVTAQNVADLARTRAKDRNRQTPFSTAAQDAGYRFYGGKMDDITVIVSYITNSKSGASAP